MPGSHWRSRQHTGYWAFVVHRISGGLLALFLPFHFWALSRAIEGEAALDSFLRWAEQPTVKLTESLLVILLAAHLAGGMRLLAIEFLAWRDWQKTVVALAGGFTLAVGVFFLLNVF
ncbi:MAG: succinate dehydrogenase [Acidiferrobacterales bacterium]